MHDTRVGGRCLGRRDAIRMGLGAALLMCCPFGRAVLPAARAQADEAVTFSSVSERDIQTPVRVEEGVGGMRVVTPYYAVFLEDGMFPDGFAYEYLDTLDGAYGVLNVYAAVLLDDPTAVTASSSAGYPAYRIYCTPEGSSATPFGGTYATAQVQGRSDDGSYCLVSVAVPYGPGFDGSAQDAAGAERSADAAQQQATSMRNRVSPDDPTSMVARDDGGIDVVAPWYTVGIPAGMFPDGWYYTYSDQVNDWSGDGSGAYFGRVLDVFPVGQESPAFSVCCVKDFSVQGEVVEVTVGVFEGDWAGWRIDVYRYADLASSSVEQELELLKPYAVLVSVTDTPNADPPLLD